ncbi:MAG: hypothetical protein FWG84_08245 [Bacteroidales bacterium]|nr:hypothetical protein [Bacteroidales bacterium]
MHMNLDSRKLSALRIERSDMRKFYQKKNNPVIANCEVRSRTQSGVNVSVTGLFRLRVNPTIACALAMTLLLTFSAFAQPSPDSPPWIKLNGYVRSDIFFDSRETINAVNGLFLFFPAPENRLDDGKDANNQPSLTMLAVTSRLNVTFRTPDILNAKVNGRIEGDFTLYSGGTTMRLRHAYGQLAWENTELLLGQTWIPAFVENCVPTVVGLATGAPYQEFARNPQIRLTQRVGKTELLAAVVSQMDYASPGPEGASPVYMRRAVVPEIDLGASFGNNHWLVGLLGSVKTLKPRTYTENQETNEKFNTSEMLTTFSVKGYGKYYREKWELKAGATYGENISENLMQGGYGVSTRDSLTGKEQYTASSGIYSWLNFVYGKTWQGSLTLCYGQNFGFDKPLYPNNNLIWGRGLDIEKMYRIVPCLFYNIRKFQLALEYELNTAYYGTINFQNGRVENSHPITNHRVAFATTFFF